VVFSWFNHADALSTVPNGWWYVNCIYM